MPAPIEFYFDFSSPFGYLASEKIDALAAKHGREVLWRPFLLGATFKTTGLGPLVSVPMKGEYSKHDFIRSARLYGVTFKLPGFSTFKREGIELTTGFTATANAEIRAATAGKPMGTSVGCKIISTPRKPTNVAKPRRQRTTSPRNITANTIMNSGRV